MSLLSKPLLSQQFFHRNFCTGLCTCQCTHPPFSSPSPPTLPFLHLPSSPHITSACFLRFILSTSYVVMTSWLRCCSYSMVLVSLFCRGTVDDRRFYVHNYHIILLFERLWRLEITSKPAHQAVAQIHVIRKATFGQPGPVNKAATLDSLVGDMFYKLVHSHEVKVAIWRPSRQLFIEVNHVLQCSAVCACACAKMLATVLCNWILFEYVH